MWGNMMGGQNWGWGGMGFGMFGMVFFWILIIVFIIALAVILVKSVFGSEALSERRQEKTALDILNERYARGEIERKEFEDKKRDLGG